MSVPPEKPSGLYCPHCQADRVKIITVADDYRSVSVKCQACLRESRLAYPPIRANRSD